MDLDLYDEFGNYIGPDLDDGDDESVEEQQQFMELEREEKVEEHEEEPMYHNQIVLHEDKKYYPSAEEVYGQDVEALVELEDQQPLTEPIIKPKVEPMKFVHEKDLPVTFYSKEYMVDMMQYPSLIRNIALVGHLHHGKTSFMDMLIRSTHDIPSDIEKETRYTDVHMLERERGLSIKAMPMTFLLPNAKGKSHLFNIIDTPGHVNFSDEVTAGLALADGAILVVDVVEGLMVNTERLIKQLVESKTPFVLVINKIDRLILELRLPPQDAYFKIKFTIEQVNNVLSKISDVRLSPEKGNVCFASTKYGWCFSLKSFAQKYAQNSEQAFDVDQFAKRLWGDMYFDSENRTFRRKPAEGQKHRTFTEFILEPLYKVIAQTIGEDKITLKRTLGSLGIYLKNHMFDWDPKPLLREVCHRFLGEIHGITQMCIDLLPDPLENAEKKMDMWYTGDRDSSYARAIAECDVNGPLMIQVVKLYNVENVHKFDCFGRVLSGSVRVGQKVRVLGEGYSPDDDEDMTIQEVMGLSIFESRYEVKVTSATAGNWILIKGVAASILKTATITDRNVNDEDPVYILRPLRFDTIPILKVAVEPVNPTELPRMLDGLRKINKSYLIVQTRVEESGEHIILGTGELYLDCVMHDLRKLYSEIDIKIADPTVRLCETVVEVSAMKCYAETPNKKNKITMICEPMEKGIAEDIEGYKVNIQQSAKELAAHFVSKYEWDILAARNIWAFGPEENGPNMLINDTLPADVSFVYIDSKKTIVQYQGFHETRVSMGYSRRPFNR
jgi:U5 small nuclear ribonucleoprotein component